MSGYIGYNIRNKISYVISVGRIAMADSPSRRTKADENVNTLPLENLHFFDILKPMLIFTVPGYSEISTIPLIAFVIREVH